MIDTLADLVPLYGMVLVLAMWLLGSYLVNRKYSKDLKLLDYNDKIKIKLSKELNVPREEILEMWFDKSLRDAKGIYVIDNEAFDNCIFSVKYTIKDNSYEFETFRKVTNDVLGF